MGNRLWREQERRLRWPAEPFFGKPYLVGTQGGSMGLAAALLMGIAVADMGADHDHRRPRRLVTCRCQGGLDRSEIVAISHCQHLPAAGNEPVGPVFGKGKIGGSS